LSSHALLDILTISVARGSPPRDGSDKRSAPAWNARRFRGLSILLASGAFGLCSPAEAVNAFARFTIRGIDS
jgi:hypothetical protein